MADRVVKVGIVEASAAGLVAFGAQPKVEALDVLLKDTFHRLNIKPGRAKPYKGGLENHPPVHDVKRWLDSLTAEDKDDLRIAQRLYATVKKRVS